MIAEIRDKVFLVTKTEEPTYEGTWKLLRQSLKRMRTDRVDLVHLHNFGDEKLWGDRKLVFGDDGAMAALREAKCQGVVRFIGASGHLHPSRFHEALDSGEIDVLMNAVNFVVRHTYDFEHKVWSRARHMNLGLVAMKACSGSLRGNRTGSSWMGSTTSRRSATPCRYPASRWPSSAWRTSPSRRRPHRSSPAPDRSRPRKTSRWRGSASQLLVRSPEWKAVYGTPLA